MLMCQRFESWSLSFLPPFYRLSFLIYLPSLSVSTSMPLFYPSSYLLFFPLLSWILFFFLFLSIHFPSYFFSSFLHCFLLFMVRCFLFIATCLSTCLRSLPTFLCLSMFSVLSILHTLFFPFLFTSLPPSFLSILQYGLSVAAVDKQTALFVSFLFMYSYVLPSPPSLPPSSSAPHCSGPRLP